MLELREYGVTELDADGLEVTGGQMASDPSDLARWVGEAVGFVAGAIYEFAAGMPKESGWTYAKVGYIP